MESVSTSPDIHSVVKSFYLKKKYSLSFLAFEVQKLGVLADKKQQHCKNSFLFVQSHYCKKLKGKFIPFSDFERKIGIWAKVLSLGKTFLGGFGGTSFCSSRCELRRNIFFDGNQFFKMLSDHGERKIFGFWRAKKFSAGLSKTKTYNDLFKE